MKRLILALILLTVILAGCSESAVSSPSSEARNSAQETAQTAPAPTPSENPLDSLTKRNFAHAHPSGGLVYDYRRGVVTAISGRNLTVFGRDQESLFQHKPYFSFYATNDYPGIQVGDQLWFVQERNGEWRISPHSNNIQEIGK